MLDSIFATANGKVVIVAFAVLALSTLALDLSPKNTIREDLKGAYVSTDNPPQTECALIYDTTRATAMLKSYEPVHYAAHERFILRHDLFYPLCYAIPLVLMLAYSCPWRGGWPRRLVLLPLAVMAFDYAENFTMLAFLRRFRANPQTPLALLELSRAFTVAKLLLLLAVFALLAGFFVAFVVRRLRARAATT